MIVNNQFSNHTAIVVTTVVFVINKMNKISNKLKEVVTA